MENHQIQRMFTCLLNYHQITQKILMIQTRVKAMSSRHRFYASLDHQNLMKRVLYWRKNRDSFFKEGVEELKNPPFPIPDPVLEKNNNQSD